MRRWWVAALAVMAGAAHAGAATQETFVYTGAKLKPGSGNGVPGVTRLRFTLAGPRPAKGKCVTGLAILKVSDGAYTLKGLLQHGFVPSPENSAQLCADAVTGALSEALSVNLELFANGVVDVSYTWQSADPARNHTADTVQLYADVEYHVSYTKKSGRLTAQGNIATPGGAP